MDAYRSCTPATPPAGAAMTTTRRRWLALAAISFVAPHAAWAGDAESSSADPRGTTFSVERDGERLRVAGSARLRADPSLVWGTLVDYERLPDFIPGMRSSRALQRDGADALIEQTGTVGWGPIQQAFRVTMRVHETPAWEVTAVAIDGDFDHFESRYRLQLGDADGTLLHYAALLRPKQPLPPLVGLPVLRLVMRRQFDALLDEVDRRAVAAG